MRIDPSRPLCRRIWRSWLSLHGQQMPATAVEGCSHVPVVPPKPRQAGSSSPAPAPIKPRLSAGPRNPLFCDRRHNHTAVTAPAPHPASPSLSLVHPSQDAACRSGDRPPEPRRLHLSLGQWRPSERAAIRLAPGEDDDGPRKSLRPTARLETKPATAPHGQPISRGISVVYGRVPLVRRAVAITTSDVARRHGAVVPLGARPIMAADVATRSPANHDVVEAWQLDHRADWAIDRTIRQ